MKKTSVNLYKDIVLVTRVRIFCATLFTNNNIKIVIKSSTFLIHSTFPFPLFFRREEERGKELLKSWSKAMPFRPGL